MATAALLAVGGIGLVLLRSRRRRLDAVSEEEEVAAPAEARLPVPEPVARASMEARAPDPAPPFVVRVLAASVEFTAEALAFELDLEITNTQAQAAEAVRPALALISAHPAQDLDIAAFHGGSASMAQAQAFDIPAAGAVRLPVRIRLARERIHTLAVQGRPMVVALLMLDLRWRAGLSIRRTGADFLLGSAGGGARPGPIWLDRGPPSALAAIAYAPAD